MEQSLSKFVDGMQTSIKKLSITELRQREETWRTLWGWIDDEVKFWVLRVGTTARIFKRDYKGVLGELGAVKFEPTEIELIVYEKLYNYLDGKTYIETKITKIPYGNVLAKEFILDRELAETVELPEVMPLESVGEPTG